MSEAQSEVAYFRAIEEDFIGRRGGALLLSSADWHLIWKWHWSRIPLRIVLRGIADAFESHAHSWNRRQSVRGLRYCADEVERARARWRRALSLDRAEALDDPSQLEGISRAWERAALPSDLDRMRDDLLRALRAEAPAGSDLQAFLAALEGRIARTLALHLGEERMGELRSSSAADLASYRGRMPQKTLDKIIEEGVTRRLFEAFGVPRLTFLA